MTDAEIKLVEKLTSQVGTAGGQAWEILCNAAWQSSMADTIQYLVLGIVMAVYIREMRRWWAKGDTEPGYDIAIFVIGLGLFLTCLIAFVSLHETIMGFVNPEYWALRKIMAACGK